jgi:hypothetical protein
LARARFTRLRLQAKFDPHHKTATSLLAEAFHSWKLAKCLAAHCAAIINFNDNAK